MVDAVAMTFPPVVVGSPWQTDALLIKVNPKIVFSPGNMICTLSLTNGHSHRSCSAILRVRRAKSIAAPLPPKHMRQRMLIFNTLLIAQSFHAQHKKSRLLPSKV
ncbi:MAG: hypothetical protein ACTHNZ_02105, partial [Trinickia sp.]|uniref:hypothetical protein n=1 Tax=Trinickia sp. TaxID=2571163 RepID=UPI003F81256E